MSRQDFARDLQDGINAHFGMAYKDHKTQYTKIFDERTSKRAYEEMVLRVGLGEAQEKSEGGMITFDQGAEGYVTRVDFYNYALAFAITEEAIDDNLYADLSEVYGKELGKSLQHAKEVRGANILNNSFNTSYAGGDQSALCGQTHPLYAGGNWSNILPTSADISEEALEDSVVQMQGWVNDRNRPIVINPKQLIIPRQLIFQTERILKSSKRVGTANNDINALKDGDYIPGGFTVNHYLVDPDAWWIQSDADMGLTYWQRKKVKKGMETDFRTGNMLYKASERFGFSWGDARCVMGSPGSPV
jgi:hypothetical protein